MIYALVAGIVGIGYPAFLFTKRKADIVFAVFRFIFFLIIGYLVYYFAHPVWHNRYGWIGFCWYFVLGSLLQAFFSIMDPASSMHGVGSIGLVVLGIALLISGYGIQSMHAMKRTFRLIDRTVVYEKGDVPSMNSRDLPLIPESTAVQMAQNSLQNYGQQYQVDQDDMSIQRLNGELMWVAPLDYQGWGTWRTTRHTPGYVLVSATNANAQPKLMIGDKYRLVYTPNACFGEDLTRLINFKYPKYPIGGMTLEANPHSLKPFWIITLYQLTTNPYLAGSVPYKVLVVDPKTANIQEFDLGKQPAWVSEAVSSEFVSKQLDAWGKSKDGWWSLQFGGHPNAKKTVDNPIAVIGNDGKMYYYTGFTSWSGSGRGLIGYAMTNAETGITQYYGSDGSSIQNGDVAKDRIGGAVQNANLTGDQPVYYNLYGHPAFIVPIVNQSNLLVEYAIVDPTNAATPVIASTLSQALDSWQQYIASGAGTSTITQYSAVNTVTGKITYLNQVIQGGNTTWYFTISGVNDRFSATLSSSPDLPFLKIGDKVTISYVNIASDINPVRTVK